MTEKKVNMLKFMLDVLDGKSPSESIELSGARGQKYIIKTCLLPKKANPYDHLREEEVMDKYIKLGIKIIKIEDDLFWKVELPEGWKIKATGHSMWNELYDNNNKKIFSFFYKAVFYDRDAFVNFERL